MPPPGELMTQSFHLKPKKALGQNFLTDANIIQTMADHIALLAKQHDTHYVHEIGPGAGALTQALLARGLDVTAFETDERAVAGLQHTLGLKYPNTLHVVRNNILKVDPKEYHSHPRTLCVGNIPYYITSPILLWFCEHREHYVNGTFMMQNEVAQRLQAASSTKDYGRLTVKLQLLFSIQPVCFVPAKAFHPKPKVDSAVVSLSPQEFSFASPSQEKAFERFCAMLFSARRKMLRRVLAAALQAREQAQQTLFWEQAATLGVEPQTRPDAISPTTMLALFSLWQLWC